VYKRQDKNTTLEQKNIIEKNSTNKKTFFYEKNLTLEKEKKDKNKTLKTNNTDNKKEVLSFIVPKVNLNENNITTKQKKSESKVKKNDKKTLKKVIKKEIKEKPLIIEEKVNINDLIKSYNQNPDYDIAIQISNLYLNKNMLDLAKLWALKANNLNPSKYESWKIFAIILLKKNQKQKAKEVLKTYLNDYGDNDEIEKLLRSIDE
jgi:predicted Zn-dependent protease